MRKYLGEFEEIILLTIGVLGGNAYGVSIKKTIKEKTGKKASIGALHTALNRLEQKGFISSKEGGATNERGGRRKRFYNLTSIGKRILVQTHRLRNDLFAEIRGLVVETQK